MHMYGNTYSAIATEITDGCVWNLVGMKYSWSFTIRHFGQINPGLDPGRGKIRLWGSPSLKNFFFRLEGYSNKPNAQQ